MIAEYASSLAARLAFDPPLARRVREEVEEHLREAVAADSAEGAERRAIERFGDARTVAAQLALASLAGQLRKVGVTVLLVLAAAFLAMSMRLAWYDFTEWGLCEAAAPLAETLGTLDHSAFWMAALAGLAAFLHDGGRRLFLARQAAAALAVSVLCDGALTALRLVGWDWSADFIVPLFTMALEGACVVLLVARLAAVARRVSPTSALQQA
jgi:hypothetical protein